MFRSTIALAALSLVFAAAPAALSAQTAAPTDSTAPATASRHHHKHVLLRGIKLTDTQRTQLKAIKAKYRPQLRAAHLPDRGRAADDPAALAACRRRSARFHGRADGPGPRAARRKRRLSGGRGGLGLDHPVFAPDPPIGDRLLPPPPIKPGEVERRFKIR